MLGGGYCLISPSKIEDGEYKPINSCEIKTITISILKRIMNFFLKEKPETSIMREPFIDILTGKIEIEEQSKCYSKPEHVYWKYVFLEAWHFLKLDPIDLFQLLERNQPAFDIKKTETQLRYVNFDDKPLTNEKMYEYFPQYMKKEEKKKQKNSSDKELVWHSIATTLMKEFDIITIKDTDQIMIKRGNIYTTDTTAFYIKLSELIVNNTKTSYTYLKNNILSYIRDSTLFDRNNFCYDNWIINFKNGYYDTTTNRFFPSDNYGDKIFFYEIPHEYKDGKYSCSKFRKCLNDWLGENNEITKENIFEMIGYTMTMNTNLKKAFFIFGEKNSGKSTFQNILEHVIGEENRSAISLQRLGMNQFGTDGLQWKIMNMVGDMSSMKVVDVSQFKVVTGGDRHIEAERKGGKQYKIRNTIKIWYNANAIPEIEHNDDAFFSRWILINFPNNFPLDNKKTIKDLSNIICSDSNEIQGILHECIKGVRRLYNRGYFTSSIVENSRHLWKMNSEPLYAFLNICTDEDKDGNVSCNDFRNSYNDYLYKNGEKPVAMKTLSLQLEKYNVFRDRLNNASREYIYTGIKWKKEGIEKWIK